LTHLTENSFDCIYYFGEKRFSVTFSINYYHPISFQHLTDQKKENAQDNPSVFVGAPSELMEILSVKKRYSWAKRYRWENKKNFFFTSKSSNLINYESKKRKIQHTRSKVYQQARICFECHTMITSVWRIRYRTNIALCNACGLRDREHTKKNLQEQINQTFEKINLLIQTIKAPSQTSSNFLQSTTPLAIQSLKQIQTQSNSKNQTKEKISEIVKLEKKVENLRKKKIKIKQSKSLKEWENLVNLVSNTQKQLEELSQTDEIG
jgi:hypothetical protein